MSINKINSDTKKYTSSEVYLNLSPYLLEFNPILATSLGFHEAIISPTQ